MPVVDVLPLFTAGTFYVYLYRDPRPGKKKAPIYVGKGKGERAVDHYLRRKSRGNPILMAVLNKITGLGLKPIIERGEHFDEEAAAYLREKELIAKYGRRDLGSGSLCNLTDGGEGAQLSPEILAKISATRKRKGLSDKQRAHLPALTTAAVAARRNNPPSDKQLAAYARARAARFKGPRSDKQLAIDATLNTLWRGSKHTAGARARMSEAKKGKPQAPEHVAKRAAIQRGKKLSPEHCAAISNAKRGKPINDKQLAAIAAATAASVAARARRKKDEQKGKE